MTNIHTTEVSVLAWNTRDGLSDEQRAPKVIDFIIEQDPDIAILTEAFRSNVPTEEARNWLAELERAGYGVTAAAQEITSGRPDQHAIAVAAKEKHILDMRKVPLNSRYGIRTHMRDPLSGREYTVFGQHGNDLSEYSRSRDAEVLGQLIGLDREDSLPTIVAGDLNTMSPNKFIARTLRAVRPLARLLPAEDPNPDNPPTGLTRFGSLAQRLTDMASGDTMGLYRRYGLSDVDSRELPTMKKAGLAVKLDHILAGADFALLQNTYMVHSPTYVSEQGQFAALSDHKAISARLRLLDEQEE